MGTHVDVRFRRGQARRTPDYLGGSDASLGTIRPAPLSLGQISLRRSEGTRDTGVSSPGGMQRLELKSSARESESHQHLMGSASVPTTALHNIDPIRVRTL